MGTIDYQALLAASRRSTRAKAAQRATLRAERAAPDDPDVLQVSANMLNARRNFLAVTDSGFLESVIERSDLMPLRYLALGQLAAASVGRIEVPGDGGAGFATGFLVAPGLLLTNWHVLDSAVWARAATVTFDAEDDVDGVPKPPRVFRLDPDRLYLSDPNLDFCFVAVRPRAVDGTPLERYGYLRLFPRTGKILRDEYATIVQHPNGRQKHIAARENRITVYCYDHDLPAARRAENDFLYYATDTLKGSSGAPVFNDQWYVVALHRRGVPATKTVNGKKVVLRKNGRPAAPDDPESVVQFVSNEGVRVSRILARLATLASG